MSTTTSYNLSTIKRHPYLASFGTTVIGPLAEPPEIKPDTKLYESRIYENGGAESVAGILLRNNATISLKSKDIATAMELIAEFTDGSDVFASTARKTLTFTPIGTTTEPLLIFTSCVLLPGLSYVPAMGADHYAVLTFRAFPNASGVLFTFEQA